MSAIDTTHTSGYPGLYGNTFGGGSLAGYYDKWNGGDLEVATGVSEAGVASRIVAPDPRLSIPTSAGEIPDPAEAENGNLLEWLVSSYDSKLSPSARDLWKQNHGTLTGTDIKATPQGWTFNGTDDHIRTLGYNGITGANPRTIMLWAKTDQTGNQPLIEWGGDNGFGAGTGFRLLIESGVFWGRFNVGVIFSAGSSLDDGEWHSFVYSYPGGRHDNARVYVDGSELSASFGNGSTSLNTGTTGNMVIGGGNITSNATGGDIFFNGTIQLPLIHNRALSPFAIRQLYEVTKPDSRNLFAHQDNYVFFREPQESSTIIFPVRYGIPRSRGEIVDNESEAENQNLVKGLVASYDSKLSPSARDLWKQNHGTLIGTDIEGTPQGWSFNGTDDYVGLGTKDIYTPSAMTVAAWISVESNQFEMRAISSVYDAGTNERGWYFGFYSSSNERLAFGFSSNGTNFDFRQTVDQIVSEQELTFVAATFDGTTGVSIYLNGDSLTLSQGSKSGTPSGMHAADAEFQIGSAVAQSGARNWFKGLLQLPMIYNVALSPSAIRQLYEVTKPDTRELLRRRDLYLPFSTEDAVAPTPSSTNYLTLLGVG